MTAAIATPLMCEGPLQRVCIQVRQIGNGRKPPT